MQQAGDVQLGPFRLKAVIGRGGMGAVWRAVHAEQGVVVAVKVLTRDPRDRPEFVERLRDEVRAVAALEHPGIAMVLDHGEVDEATARDSGGELLAGSPWFAMEYAPGGTLARWPKRTFTDLKRGWLRILDALAHAHGRGVIHRDLKPGNILLDGPPDPATGIKLVDFGVAFARLDTDATGPMDEQVVGTPQYMAPEQLRGEWRDYGPWTDLYGFGCVAWLQLTGVTPFAGRNATETLMGHLLKPIPQLASKLPVPPELEAWMRGLLEKDPTRRFQRAADVAHALAAIGEAIEPVPASVIPDWADTQVWDRPTPTPTHRPRATGERPKPAPMPVTWRRDEPPPPPTPLFGAGLRLFGLRRVPLVGREAERDALWSRLGDVTRTGRAHVVVVRGAAGTGKSALVQWLCERAHETGAAAWAKATFAPHLTQGEPLQRMAVTWMRTRGLPRPEVRERIVRFLETRGSADEVEADVLTELLHPASPEDLAAGARPIRLSRMREHYAATRNGMARVAAERPLIAWFDDVQWGIHGIGMATQTLRVQDEQPTPILLVLTVRDEALVPGSIEEDRLDRLLAMGATEVTLPPLPREDQAELVSRMLWLAPELAAQVVDRTAGNPLFAVQLVSAMVQRGELALGPRGLELATGAPPDLPENVAALWQRRLERLLREFPSQAETFLEIAAVLGTPVDRREWRRACDDPEGFFGDRFRGDEPLRAQLVERLIEERLATRTATGEGWAFVHGMLEEALVAAAARAGRLIAHHEAAAAVLRPRAEDPFVAERLGLHLLAAGRPDDAVEPLLRGIEVRWVSTGAASAMALLQRASQAASGLPKDDPRRGRLLVLTAGLHLELGDVRAARQAADDAVGCPGSVSWRGQEVRAALALREGRIDEAEAAWRELLGSDDARARASGEKGLGQIDRRRHAYDEAARHFRAAAALFAEAGEPVEAATCDVLYARVELLRGEVEDADAALERAREAFVANGAVAGLAQCFDALARVRRGQRRWADAEGALRQALALYETTGAQVPAHICRLRLATWLAADPERVREVGALVERASRLAGLELDARDIVHGAARWAAAALRGDRAGWDAGLDATASAILRLASPRNALAAETVAWLGWTAAAALPADERPRRERATAGVFAIFQALGRADLVHELGDFAGGTG